MKKKLALILVICMMMVALFSGCGNKDSETPSSVNTEQEKPNTRIVTDFTGKEIELPPPDEIKRVLIASPPVPSTYFDVMKGSAGLVGATERAFTWGNSKVMDLIVPNWREINTTWIKGNTCNVEEILALEPDLVIVYGKEQAEGLDVLPMPVLNFLESSKDNEQTTINRDKFMREIFGVDSDTSLEEEWKTANEKVAQCLSAVEGQPQPKALMIFNNTGEKITVRGSNTYGDSWITKSGMINVAAEVEGDGVEVTMEQIYQWNPDIIIVHGGLPETDYLTNSISGQDWSQVEAFKNGRIYYTPKGISAWTAPNADSPMMAQWMVMRAYPDTYPEEEFVSNLISYYQRRYGVEITEDLAEEIIWPHGPAE